MPTSFQCDGNVQTTRCFPCPVSPRVPRARRHHCGRSGRTPGTRQRSAERRRVSLTTDGIDAAWTTERGSFRVARLTDRIGHRTITPAPDPFILRLKDGTTIRASAMHVRSGPKSEKLHAVDHASRYTERLGGKAVRVELEDPATGLRVTWRALARDGSRYLRQEVTLTPTRAPMPVSEIVLLDLEAKDAAVVGEVKGSPIVAGNIFFGFEHPLSTHVGERNARHRCRSAASCRCAPARRSPFRRCSAHGDRAVAPRFPRLPRARTRPPVPDLPALQLLVRPRLLQQVRRGRRARRDPRLRRRTARQSAGVTLSSFLFDDGWDDSQDALALQCRVSRTGSPISGGGREVQAAPGRLAVAVGRLRQAAQGAAAVRQGAGLRDQRWRLRALGPEVLPALPRHLRATSSSSTASTSSSSTAPATPSRVVPGARFDSDFDAMISLIGDLRQVEAGPLRQPHHRHLPLAVLAALLRLDLARRRG